MGPGSRYARPGRRSLGPREGSTSGCAKWRPGQFHCFRLILTMEIATATCSTSEAHITPICHPRCGTIRRKSDASPSVVIRCAAIRRHDVPPSVVIPCVTIPRHNVFCIRTSHPHLRHPYNTFTSTTWPEASMSAPSFRRDFISKPIFRWAQQVLPTLSDTEREAIEAGDVWWDADLFGGNPDWGKLLAVPPATLSPEEQAFLDGPVDELCRMLDEWRISWELRD